MNILLFGSTGQMGRALVDELGAQNHVIALSHEDVDIGDFKKVREIVCVNRPDVVVNTAAYHRVAECEKNVLQSFFVNGFCVRHIARCCKDAGAALMHFSTDYVFSGKNKKAYREEDIPAPLNVYGLSKLTGELFIRDVLHEHFIIRVSAVFHQTGSRQKSGNFLTQILGKARRGEPLSIVNDMVFSPTYAPDCAKALADVLAAGKYGTYHVTNAGSCSWHEFAKTFFKNLKMKVNIHAMMNKEFKSGVNRPLYTVLENARLGKLHISPARHWKDALKDFCRELKSN